MNKLLLEMESVVLEQGREWTRKRLEETLQEAANAIPAVCPQSGLVLKKQQTQRFTLKTVSGTVCLQAIRGYSSATGQWHCPAREQWGLAPKARLSPELEKRLAHNAGAAGSYEKAAELAGVWGTPISDDTVHAVAQKLGAQIVQSAPEGFAPPPEIKKNEAPFNLVIMLDGWLVRERGPGWGMENKPGELKAIEWKEVKSAVIFRLEDRVATESGRRILVKKKVVAAAPDTDVVDLGAMIQAEAMRMGLVRAREVFVVADGAIWIWNLVKDRFGDATKTLDFYHASEHLWALAHHLHSDKEKAAAWVNPLLDDLRHRPEHRVVERLEELLQTHPKDEEVIKEVGYFQRNRDKMNYKNLADRESPIGSGAMESACSQFQNRLKRRGQFWSRDGLTHLLALDVALKNETLPFLWN